jgi:uncharacterized SAM-binding protein YcdF (DUF218 family)
MVPKFLSHIPGPVGIVLVLLAVAAYKRSRAWSVAAAVTLVILSSSVFSNYLLSTLETAYPVVSPADVQPADAIVVLGGITRSAPTYPEQRFDLSEAVERIDEAIRLYRADKAPYLVLTSGGHAPVVEEGDFLRKYAIEDRDLPSGAVLHTALVGHNTAEEALEVKRLVVEKGWRNVILVTSAFHMPRSVRLFRRANVDGIVPYPVDFRSFRDPREALGASWLPRAGFLENTEVAMREYYGIVYYNLVSKP